MGKIAEHVCMEAYAKEVGSIKVRQLEFARMMCLWVNFFLAKSKKATMTRPQVYSWSRTSRSFLRCSCSYLFSAVISIDTVLITVTTMFIPTFVIITGIIDTVAATTASVVSIVRVTSSITSFASSASPP
eukprot:s479_g6.t1